VQSIRKFRVIHNLSNKDILYYSINKQLTMKVETLIYKLANAKVKKNKDALFVLSNYKLHIMMNKEMKAAEKKRLAAELLHLENEIKRSKKILSNDKFMKNASNKKIAIEKEKYAKYKKAYEDLTNK
jgi:valyl-tRNA synthetase